MAGNTIDHKLFMDSTNLTFDSYFKLTNLTLILCGAHPSRRGRLSNICVLLIKAILSTFITIEIITVYEDLSGVRDRIDAIRQIALMCICFLAYLKLAALIAHRNNVDRIFGFINEDYYAASTRLDIEASAIVASFARFSKTVQYFWYSVLGMVVLSFPVNSFAKMVSTARRGEGFPKVMMSEFYVPFYEERKYESPVFEITSLITLLTAVSICLAFVAYDGFTLAVMIHLCGKLEVLNKNLRNFIPGDYYDSNATIDKLRQIVQEHQLCFRLADHLQSVIGTVHLVVFLLNSIIITFTGYQVMRGYENGYVSGEFIITSSSTLIHIFLPCYFCDQLTEKSVDTSRAVYESGWEWKGHYDQRLRSLILILIMRAQKPLVIKTAGVGPINLQMFSNVVRTSWSYFTLVRQKQHN